MGGSLVAERYAKALFELSLEKGLEEEVYQDSLLITKTCDGNRELRLLLKSPIVNTRKKLVIMEAIFKGNLNQLTLTYLLIMVRKNREALIPEIAAKLADIFREYKNILTVHFAAPVAPDETTRKQVLALMEKYSQSTIDLKPEIDESLIGGFVIRWKDKQYDASIKREIENIRNVIAKINLYKKGF